MIHLLWPRQKLPSIGNQSQYQRRLQIKSKQNKTEEALLFRQTPCEALLEPPINHSCISHLLFNASTIRVADDARADDPLRDDASNVKYPVINFSRVRISISFLPCAIVGSSSIMATIRGTIQELASLTPKCC